MSDSKDLETVVRDLVRENNVKLKELITPVVTKIAGEFTAAGLVPSEMEDQILVTGVEDFKLAAKLVNACRTMLTMYPDKNFPKFIGILKKYETMKLLAKEMESTFEQARELCFNAFVAPQLASLFKRTTNRTALLCIATCLLNGTFVFSYDERDNRVAIEQRKLFFGEISKLPCVDSDTNLCVGACVHT